jgi:Flp pilus assembly pilin Flp
MVVAPFPPFGDVHRPAGGPICDERQWFRGSARHRFSFPELAGGENNREYEMNELEMNVDLESGQTMAEYAVVLTVITVAAVASLALLSSTVTNLLSSLVPLI